MAADWVKARKKRRPLNFGVAAVKKIFGKLGTAATSSKDDIAASEYATCAQEALDPATLGLSAAGSGWLSSVDIKSNAPSNQIVHQINFIDSAKSNRRLASSIRE